jgi:uncharacterized protein YkwD
MRFLNFIFLVVIIFVAMLFPKQFISTVEYVKNKGTEALFNQVYDQTEEVNLPNDGLHLYINSSSSDVINTFGEPDRKDPTAYGYEWWIYKGKNDYAQFAVKDQIIVSAFGIGDGFQPEPFNIGQSRDVIKQQVQFPSEIKFSFEGNHYTFTLSNKDLQMRPIVRLENGWVQLYFDTFTNKLSNVRYLNTETLLLHRPYTIQYRGTLPEQKAMSRERWSEVERANEKQVFDLSNIIRKRFNLKRLDWHNKVSQVAFGHSKDMSINEYFAHESPTHGDLGDRLAAGNVMYSFAGENIASNYVDSLSAVEGWLNSEGHRKALLHKDYTHLGVGVYEKYYTQNFITP